MWMQDDNTEVLDLRRKLKEIETRFDSFQNEQFKQDQEFQRVKRAYDDLIVHSQQETDRCTGLERQLKKKSDELHQEILQRQNLESALNSKRDDLKQRDKSVRNLQFEVDNLAHSSTSSSTAYEKVVAERSTLEKRVRELEESLHEAQSSSQQQPSLAASRRGHQSPAAQIIDLENRILALQADNARLSSLTPHTPRRALANSSRRRSSSLSTPSSHPQIVTLNAELVAVRDKLEKEEAKSAKLSSDLMQAENELLASQKRVERSRQEGEDWKEQLSELTRAMDEMARGAEADSDLSSKVRALEEERRQESERADAAEKDARAAKAAFVTAREEISRLESTLANKSANHLSVPNHETIATLQDDVRVSTQQLDALKRELEVRDAELVKEKAEVAIFREEVSRLSASLTSATSDEPNDRLRADLQALQDEQAAVLLRIESSEFHNMGILATGRLSTVFNELLRVLSEQRAAAMKVENELAACKAEILASTNQRFELDLFLLEVQQQLREKSTQLEDATQQLHHDRDEILHLSRAISDHEERAVKYEQSRIAADATSAKLQHQLAEHDDLATRLSASENRLAAMPALQQRVSDLEEQLKSAQDAPDHRTSKGQEPQGHCDEQMTVGAFRSTTPSTVPARLSPAHSAGELKQQRRRIAELETQVTLADDKLQHEVGQREARERAYERQRQISHEADHIYGRIREKEMDLLNELQSLKAENRLLQEKLCSLQWHAHSEMSETDSTETVQPVPSNAVDSTELDPTSSEQIEHMARLLTAVDRLRSERDELRRSLSFARSENKFALADLRDRLSQANEELLLLKSEAAANTVPNGLDVAQQEPDMLGPTQAELAQVTAHLSEAKSTIYRLGQLFIGSLVVVQHASGNAASFADEARDRKVSLSDLSSRFTTTAEQLTLIQEQHTIAVQAAKQAQSELQDISAQRSTLQLEVQQLNYSLSKAREELDDAQSTITSLRDDLATSAGSPNEALGLLRSQRDDLEQRVVRRAHQIEQHHNSVKRLEMNLKVCEETISDLQLELDDRTVERDGLLLRSTSAEQARDQAICCLEEALKEKVDVEEALAELQSAQHLIQASARTSQEAAAQELVATIAAFFESAQRARALSSNLRIARVHLSNMAEVVRLKDLESQTLLAERKTAYDDRKDVLDENSLLHAQMAEMAARLEARAQEILRLTEDIATARSEVEIISDRLSTVQVSSEMRVEGAQSSVSQLTTTVADLQLQLDILQRDLELSTEQRMRTEQAEETLRSESRQLQAALESAEQRLARTSEDVASLELQLAVHREELSSLKCLHAEELSSTVKDASTKQLALETAIEELRSDLDVLRQKNSELEVFSEKAKQFDSMNQQLQLHLEAHREETEGIRQELRATSEQNSIHLHHIDELQEQLRSQMMSSEQDHTRLHDLLQNAEQRCARSGVSMEQLTSEVAKLKQFAASQEKLAVALDLGKASLEVDVKRAASARKHLNEQLDMRALEVTQLRMENARLSDELSEARQTAAAAMASMPHSQQRLPHSDQSVAEAETEKLNSRIEVLEDQLRRKAAEAEEADDKMIEILKEKRKLTTRAEGLAKKLQNLQSKLQTNKPASIGTSTPATSGKTVPTPSRSMARTPSISANIFGDLPTFPLPNAGAGPVMEMDLPSIKPLNLSRKTAPPSPIAGKKRAASDDFTSSETVPLQAVVVESPASLRVRKNMPTRGFTPRRGLTSLRANGNQNSPAPTPRRGALPSAPTTITDITNSPRRVAVQSDHLKPPPLSHGRVMSAASEGLFNQISRTMGGRG